MNLPQLSIKRPVFVTCVFLVILALGAMARGRLTTALYPDVSFPVVNVVVPFPGAGPDEIESQIAKPLENAMGSIAGVRTIRSISLDGAALVTGVFSMDTDIRYAEQKVIEAVAGARGGLPSGILEPRIQTVDPAATPVLTLSLTADVPETELVEVAEQQLRPLLQQIPQVGLVEIQGARGREIHVDLDERKLRARQMTAGEVVGRLMAAGKNIPAGEIGGEKRNVLVRTVGEFDSLDQLRQTPIRFVGNEAITTLSDVGKVSDGLADEQNRVYLNGTRALVIKIFRQSGGNSVRVSDAVQKQLPRIDEALGAKVKGFRLAVVRDGAKAIRDGTRDATDAILIGVILTILVVLLFLGNVRSTIITGLALPNSLLGSFLLMWLAGFSVNITTLAALSLAVGLLIDDAIVVRENIFRRIEEGEPAPIAAVNGTNEVALAVLATTFTVLSVFGPVSFLQGIIGQFFREFGLTICFAMMISLLDSLTVAPMLSAYFAGVKSHAKQAGTLARAGRWLFTPFRYAFNLLERGYLAMLRGTIRFPFPVLVLGAAVFVLSYPVLQKLPKNFVPSSGGGEFQVFLDAPAGTSLDAMDRLANSVDGKIRQHADVDRTVLTVGGEHGEQNQASILVELKSGKARKLTTNQVKDLARRDLKGLTGVTSQVQDVLDIGGGAGQPFVLKITGDDLEQLKKVSQALVDRLRKDPDLKDVDRSYRPGASELRVTIEPKRAKEFGVSSAEVGQELRLFLAGTVPAQYHEAGRQYDVRVRLRPDQRDFRRSLGLLAVPNVNHRLVPLREVAKVQEMESPAVIARQDRERFIEVSADVNPSGHGLAAALDETRHIFDSGEITLPPGVRYQFSGQTADFQDLLSSVIFAVALSVIFMYLVLASLYESFFVPFSIMLVLPLAVCGAFYALALMRSGLDIYSMIGCILLLGVAAKNSILLVDYIHDGIREGKTLREAILHAGKVRVRPIMMTSFALIAGMLPVAIPLEESAKQRAGMAIAVIGGLVTSTLLTLVVVPAAYGYILKFQQAVTWVVRKVMGGSRPET